MGRMSTPIGISFPLDQQIASKVMEMCTLRQQAITSNIANASVPGYQRVDVSNDFSKKLQALMVHGDSQSVVDLPLKTTVDAQAKSTRLDGNNVSLEHELMQMSANSVAHEFASLCLTDSLRRLETSITGRVI